MPSETLIPYDAVLLISFGGPEKVDDVMPFLENVTRGRNIPRERLLDVAEHYYHFGGKSPINDQCRELMAALKTELERQGSKLPIYWGNRNWNPFLTEALEQMKKDGVHRALGLVTSAYSSYSSCRQYRENVAAAQATVGEGAPAVDKLRVYYNHPEFIESSAERLREAFAKFPSGHGIPVLFTAHSIPLSAAESSDYQKQLEEACRLVAAETGVSDWKLVYQSRSGAPGQPWLEPDILDALKATYERGVRDVVVAPIGFISDHMEVLFDLDIEAADLAHELGMTLVRCATVGTHPRFVHMLAELIRERTDPSRPRLAIGQFGPNHDVCPVGCCPAPQRPIRPEVSA